jgi:hypothetical protein
MQACASCAGGRTGRKGKAFSLASFQDFKLSGAIAHTLAKEKYLTPTPIEAQITPPPARISKQPPRPKGSAHG